jgi:thiol-disulfide isomerase/thioredoxin
MSMHLVAVLASSLLALTPLAQDAPTIQKAPPSKAPVPAAETEAGPHAKLLAMLGPELEKADGSKVKTTDALEGRKNVLIYFTASWCGPCRRFTPDLVKYANEHEKATDFTIILVGSDRSADAQQSYMEKSKMPFLAVPFGSDAAKKIKQKYAGSGIPNLLILDETGAVLKGSYETDGRYSPENRGSYIGPQQVLAKFTQMRADAEKAASTEAG